MGRATARPRRAPRAPSSPPRTPSATSAPSIETVRQGRPRPSPSRPAPAGPWSRCPGRRRARHAHLCELTRGLLSELPALFDLEPGHGSPSTNARPGAAACAATRSAGRPTTTRTGRRESDSRNEARGHAGRRRAADGDAAAANGIDDGPVRRGDRAAARSGRRRPGRLRRSRRSETTPDRSEDATERHVDGSTTAISPTEPRGRDPGRAAHGGPCRPGRGPAERPVGRRGRRGGPTRVASDGRAEAEAEAARARAEVERLEQLLEGRSAPTLDLLELDIDSLLSELATRADLVISRRPLPPDGAGGRRDAASNSTTAASTTKRHGRWPPNCGAPSTDDGSGTIRVVDIASPRRRYGRLAVFDDPGTARVRGRRPGAAAVSPATPPTSSTSSWSWPTPVGATRRRGRSCPFREQLSGLTNLAQALQILADTVPEVTGCGQSTVYLWDQEARGWYSVRSPPA